MLWVQVFVPATQLGKKCCSVACALPLFLALLNYSAAVCIKVAVSVAPRGESSSEPKLWLVFVVSAQCRMCTRHACRISPSCRELKQVCIIDALSTSVHVWFG